MNGECHSKCFENNSVLFFHKLYCYTHTLGDDCCKKTMIMERKFSSVEEVHVQTGSGRQLIKIKRKKLQSI